MMSFVNASEKHRGQGDMVTGAFLGCNVVYWVCVYRPTSANLTANTAVLV